MQSLKMQSSLRVLPSTRPSAKRSVRAFVNPEQNGVHTPATTTPVLDSKEEKVQATISSLDALLGDAAKPTPKPTFKPTSQSAASTSQPSSGLSWPTPSTSQPAGKPAAPSQKKAQQSFEKVMAFEGFAPEIINGRAAMIGIIMALGAEISTGESVFGQIVSGGGLKMLIVIAAVSVASLAPLLLGNPAEQVFNKDPKKARAFGPFAPDSELINARAAMVGFAALLLLEGASGTAFFL